MYNKSVGWLYKNIYKKQLGQWKKVICSKGTVEAHTVVDSV